MYSKEKKFPGTLINAKNPYSLYKAGFNSYKETAFIIHGFNGTFRDKHMQFLKDAYLFRNFNVIQVDWSAITQYPCYLSSLVNTKIVAQCTAQIYAMLTHHGNDREKITCVGHSLGAHICGMISNHITRKQHRIVGLDPAKPLVQMSKPPSFRLTADDADHTQVIHTNAGILGQDDSNVDLHFCVNGGRFQPYCKGNPIRRSRCSHFLSICYLASAMFKSKEFIGVPCEQCVEISGPGRLPVFYNDPYKTIQLTKKFRIGNDAPIGSSGTYCIDVPFAKHCPFGD
ncbi:hypothetical protein ACFFRR_004426 [Megaselia abdita]